MTSHPRLAGTMWYVPAENLLAYLCDPALRLEQAVADQTLWSISSATEGGFEGTSTTRLWAPTPAGGLTALGTTTNALAGTITETGEIIVVFTPEDPDQPQTVGYGHLRLVEGEWRMEMQMATGSTSLAIHWAYMTRWAEGDPGPAPPERLLPDPGLRSDEWCWLFGSTWSAVDAELFPQGARFAVDRYRNGYLFGEGAAADGASLRVAGSVTPEGTLYILFSLSDQPAVARRGAVEPGEAPRMFWTLPGGGPVIGTATQRTQPAETGTATHPSDQESAAR